MVRTFLLPLAQSAPLSLSILQAAAAAHTSGGKKLAFRVVLAPNEPLFERTFVRDLRAKHPQLIPESSEYFVDVSKPKEVAEAMEACDGVILSFSPPESARGSPLVVEYEKNLVDAAKEVGLSHLVKVSCAQGLLGEHSSVESGRAHWRVEQQIRQLRGGFNGDVAFVRPNTSMDTFLHGRMHEMICGRTLSMSVKSGRVAFVHPMDVAEAVIKLAQGSNSDDKAREIGEFDVTGAEALSYAQVVEKFSQGLGQKVRYSYFPLWAVQTALWIKGVRPDEIASDIAMANALEGGAEAQVTNTIKELLGHEPRSFDDFVKENRDKWPLASYK
ncbi:hypothetical protein Gpo141_00010524 [Globisporangium polare]